MTAQVASSFFFYFTDENNDSSEFHFSPYLTLNHDSCKASVKVTNPLV